MLNDMERISEIKHTYENQWMALDGVVAVGIGLTSEDKAGIIVSVAGNINKIRESLPECIDGIPVEIKESGTIEAL